MSSPKSEAVTHKGRAEVESSFVWTADLSVELGTVKHAAWQLANLRPGDVLILDQTG